MSVAVAQAGTGHFVDMILKNVLRVRERQKGVAEEVDGDQNRRCPKKANRGLTATECKAAGPRKDTSHRGARRKRSSVQTCSMSAKEITSEDRPCIFAVKRDGDRPNSKKKRYARASQHLGKCVSTARTPPEIGICSFSR